MMKFINDAKSRVERRFICTKSTRKISQSQVASTWVDRTTTFKSEGERASNHIATSRFQTVTRDDLGLVPRSQGSWVPIPWQSHHQRYCARIWKPPISPQRWQEKAALLQDKLPKFKIYRNVWVDDWNGLLYASMVSSWVHHSAGRSKIFALSWASPTHNKAVESASFK